MQELFSRFERYTRLTRFDRPIGSLLLLWPTLWALWIAGEGVPDPYVVSVFIFGTFLMRSAGCVINDYADRDFDAHVERTRDRPLATGEVSKTEALILFSVLCLLAFLLVLSLNRSTIYLSFIAVGIACIYPFTKRVTHLPQLVLGIAFSWGIPMAFAAQLGSVPMLAWWLLLANLCWVMAYDTMYAMADRDDDLKIGIKSTAILFGKYDRVVIAIFQSLCLLILICIGLWLERDVFYYAGLLVATFFAIYQQWCIRERDRGASFSAFLNNTWFGAAVFAGLLLSYLPSL